MTKECAIKLSNVTKTFKLEIEDNEKKSSILNKNPTKVIENTVLDNISLNISKGEVVGIIGRNGSGKSTLLSIMAKIMEPTSGTIEINGKIASIMELGMGFHPDLTGRQNIYIKGEMYGFSHKEIEKRIDKIIEYSGISRYIDNPVRTYSTGMSGRLAFAIMLNVESEIMLIDEILSVGDSTFVMKAQQHFKQLSKSDKTIVIVSHNLKDLEQLCTRTIWIENGKIKKDGLTKNVLAEYQFEMSEDPEIIMDLAIAGVAESQYKLALMYKDGSRYGQDLSLYNEWIKKAADQGHTLAQVSYANYLISNPLETDISTAIQYYQSAANKGNNEAKIKLSTLNSHNSSIHTEILETMKKMVVSENPILQYRYADTVLKLAYSEEERKESFEYFNKSALSNYAPAIHQTAIMYRDGIGTTRDLTKMAEMLDKACNIQYIPSLIMYADMLLAGTIVKKDENKSFNLYLKAASLGNPKSQYQVATMLKDGIGCEINIAESEKWFSIFSASPLSINMNWAIEYLKSIDNGSTYKKILIESKKQCNISSIANIISLSISDKEQDNDIINENIQKLTQIASTGNIDAIRRVANYYHDGIGIEKDRTEAYEWYKQGSDLGNNFCKLKLGEMYRDGDGVEKNYNMALKHFNESLEGNIPAAATNIINMRIANFIDDDNVVFNAVEKLNKLAINGNIDAIRRLGNMYYSGIFVKKSYPKALKIYEIGASFKDPISLVRCGEMYRDGKGKAKNLERATYYFRCATDLNITAGMWNLYNLYSTKVLEDNVCMQKILEKMKINAYNGDIDAIRKCASIYCDGMGIKQDYSEALQMYTLGAKLGDILCKNKCVEMYREGKGTAINEELVLSWALSI